MDCKGTGVSEKNTARHFEILLNDETFLVIELPTLEPRDDRLTAAEQEVATLAAEGLANREIARKRGTSESTVANQMASVLGKLKVGSRFSLAGCLTQLKVRSFHSRLT